MDYDRPANGNAPADPERRTYTPRTGDRPVAPTDLERLPPRPQRQRMAVFGGSFNPIHNGHLFLAGNLLRENLADEVLFIPAGQQPHKPAEALAPAEQRLAMLHAALDPFTAFGISDIEIRRAPEPAYTFDTMETLHMAFPEHDLIFVMGADCLAELHTWHRATELVTHQEFIIHPRPGVDLTSLATLVGRFGTLGGRKLRGAILRDPPLLPVSASQIRDLCAQGKSLAGLVPEAVIAFIQKQELYGHPKPRERQHRR